MDTSYVGDHDDWLEDDLGVANKRKRPTYNSVFTTSGMRKAKKDMPSSQRHTDNREQVEDDNTSHQRKRRSRSGERGVEDNDSTDHQRKRRRELSPDEPDITSAEGTLGFSHVDDIDVALLSDNSNDAFTSDTRHVQELNSNIFSSSSRSQPKKLSTKKQVTLTSMGLGRTSQSTRRTETFHGDVGGQTGARPSAAPPSQSSGNVPTLLMRLRVKIGERCILVPVTER